MLGNGGEWNHREDRSEETQAATLLSPGIFSNLRAPLGSKPLSQIRAPPRDPVYLHFEKWEGSNLTCDYGWPVPSHGGVPMLGKGGEWDHREDRSQEA